MTHIFPFSHGVEQRLILDVFKSCRIYLYIIYSHGVVAYPHTAASVHKLGTTEAAINR